MDELTKQIVVQQVGVEFCISNTDARKMYYIKLLALFVMEAQCVLGTVGTYLLTPWSRVLLEKLTGLQLAKKFPSFYGT
jgi:hypothetical protein